MSFVLVRVLLGMWFNGSKASREPNLILGKVQVKHPGPYNQQSRQPRLGDQENLGTQESVDMFLQAHIDQEARKALFWPPHLHSFVPLIESYIHFTARRMVSDLIYALVAGSKCCDLRSF